MKRKTSLVIALLLILNLFVPKAYAEGESGSISVEARYEKQALPGMEFTLYKVADMDGEGTITYTAQVMDLPIVHPTKVSELSDAEWLNFTNTLVQYEEKLSAAESGETDEKGDLHYSGSYPLGLYLIVGKKLTHEGKTYSPSPALVKLPTLNGETRQMEYDLLVRPKMSEGGDSKTIQIRKQWDDATATQARPKSVQVRLLKDGKLEETVSLSEPSWSYTWTNLGTQYAWTVQEVVPSGYRATYSINGNVYTLTNVYAPKKYVTDDPPITKTVRGNPATRDRFIFTLEAVNNNAGVSPTPMPAGTVDGKKSLTVYGAGEYEFGDIVFTVPGTYTYRIIEQQTNVAGYTYDTSVYTISYLVRDDASSPTGMSLTRTITKSGSPVTRAEFVNTYNPGTVVTPTPRPGTTATPTPGTTTTTRYLPQTGQLWWPVPMLLAAGLLLILFGVVRKRKETR